MFQYLTIEDTVILTPDELDDVDLSATAQLQARYQGKTIPGEGHCLLVRNIKTTDKIVIHGEGSLQVHCQFECVVMKPLPGTVLQGQVSEQGEHGLVVKVCEQAIHVPAGAMH